MRLLFLLIVLYVFSLKVSFAQRVFHGSIKDNKGKPLEAVTVTLKDTSGNTINFARTNDKGLFSISYKEDQIAGFTIESSSIGYKKLI
ncbi:MAG: carboxypeptidase regulatory-like domain-containing protein, partial [Pedobacter sp.]